MDKINWKRKLSSRKLWLALVGIIFGIILFIQGDTITGAKLIGGSIGLYMAVEGYVDGKAAGAAIGDAITDAILVTGKKVKAIK